MKRSERSPGGSRSKPGSLKFGQTFLRIQREVGSRKRRLYGFLLFVMLCVGLFESLATFWIAAYASILAEPNGLANNDLFIWLSKHGLIPIDVGFERLLVWGSVVMIILILGKNVSKAVSLYLMGRYSAAIGAQFGETLLRIIIEKSYMWFCGRDPGYLQQIVLWKNHIADFLVFVLRLLSDSILFLALFVTLLIYNAVITGPLISSLIFFSVIFYFILRKQIDKDARKTRTHELRSFHDLRAVIQGYKNIKISGVAKNFLGRYKQEIRALIPLESRKVLLNSSMQLILEVLGFLMLSASVIILVLGLSSSAGEALSLMALLAVTSWRVIPAIGRLMSSQAGMRRLYPMLESMFELLDEKSSGLEEILEESADRAHAVAFREIRLRGVGVRYLESQEFALRDIDLDIKRGEKIGIVGVSGSGKTTLIDVISGLIRPTEGSITVDDGEGGSVMGRGWTSTVSYLPQKVYLVDGSISDNVAFGIPENEVSWTEVEKSCKRAELGEIWDRLSSDEISVGDEGKKLSGGEAQRIGLARLFYRNTPLWLIDEGTASLDRHTEHRILEEIFKDDNGTILFITHRLETVLHCDSVVWIDEGSVKLHGKPKDVIDELLASGRIVSGEDEEPHE